jgi:anti-sigma factor RsiW
VIRWFRRPKDMTCEQVAQLLQHYLDHEVEDGTASQVSLHLGGCEHCGIEYTVYQDIRETLVRRVRLPVDPSVMDTLHRFCDDLTHGRIASPEREV